MTEKRDPLKVYLLCRYADESSLYNSWLGELPQPYVVVDDCPADWQPPTDAGIIVTHEHYRWEEIHALRRAYEQRRVPVLILADGILEYRNTWQNPTIPEASMYQPLLADKIACIGNASARIIESWGNPGKPEVVGMPRLDYAAARTRPAVDRADPFRLLIATATTPAFTPDQRATVADSLRCLKDYLDRNAQLNGRAVQVSWRLTDDLDVEIGMTASEDPAPTLIDAIESAEAVITTPSTIYLESALLHRPTAILDFSNSPPLVPSAWSITAEAHIPSVLAELTDPPPARLLFQNYTLHDNLQCRTPAAPRLVELISCMIETGRQQRMRQQPIAMPLRMLTDDLSHYRPHDLDLPEWYPDNDWFQVQEAARLQAELVQAIARLDTCPRELADKNRQITQLQSSLDESRRRLADVRSRLFKLRKILGIGKENQSEETLP